MSDHVRQLREEMLKLQEEFELTDIGCANLVKDSDQIKFINKSFAFVWDDTELLWKPLNTPIQVSTTIHKILLPIVKKKLTEYKQYVDVNDKKVIKELQQIQKGIRSLSSSRKLQQITNVCGDSVVEFALFDSKTQTDNILPVRSGILDIVTLKTRPRRKDDYFTFALDVDLCIH